MTDDIKAIRDALAAGPRSGEWTAGNMNPLLFGLKQGHGTEPLGFVYGPSLAEKSAHGQQCLATAAYIASVHPERIARLLDALEQAQKDAQRWRYLRDEEGAHSVFSAAYFNTTTADELDAAIDAAMSDAPGA